MNIQKIFARAVKDSRDENTIQIIVETDKGKFITSAPSGKSKGKYEAKSYAKSLQGDINSLNNLDIGEINNFDIKKFEDFKKIEDLIDNEIGANSLFALEASLLKALARENNFELYEFLLISNSKIKERWRENLEYSKNLKLSIKKSIAFPRPVGNAIGGGLHSKGREGKKPDFQEFLFIADGNSFSECVKVNEMAYKLAGKFLKNFIKKRNDEGAFETSFSNEEILDIMKKVKEELKKKKVRVDIGIDVASSSFYKKGYYEYKNFHKELDRDSQINYIAKIAKKYNLFYVEDPLEENDFDGFAELMFELNKSKCLIVGDDLTTTNPERFEKAIRLRAINAIIVKPNQIGSLLKVKKVIDIAKKSGIKTIISHRSGETLDDTIADLCIGFQCDFIKSGIYGPYRRAKLKRLMEIERKVKG